jgi:hypothetical protein
MIEVALVREQHAHVASLVRALDADTVALPDAVTLWETFDAIECHAAAAKLLLARKVDESGAWKRAGCRSAAEFVATRSGCSIGAAANPKAEQRLLSPARRASVKELRDEALRTRAAADPDPGTTRRRIHTHGRVRSWTDGEGAWNLAARGTADAGARFEAELNALIDELFKTARAEGRREEPEAYAFDALMALADRQRGAATKRSAPAFLALLRIDLEALRRGGVRDDELCEITGIGPIPAMTARELLGESILELVITKGVDVLNVTHLGRGPTAAQRVALLWASPHCTVEGCARIRVEIDHRVPYAQSGHTRLDELDPLCKHHHDRKHHEGWALVEGTGKRVMIPPGDPRHPKNRPRRDTS